MTLETRLQSALEAANLGTIHHERPGAWLAQATTRLSLGLTRERSLAGRPYLDDQDLRAAYVAMFWPVSYLQTTNVLRASQTQLGRVLDIGGGTGASAAAALDCGATSVTIVDHAADALGFCARLFAGQNVQTVCTDAEAFAPTNRYDTILAVHLVNELFKSDPNHDGLLLNTIQSWLNHLTENGRLVIIEPALRDLGLDLLRLRDQLVDAGLTIEAPCIFQGPCPALQANDWCHTSMTWNPPAWMRQLAEDSGLDRTRIKMAYLVVSKRPTTAPAISDDSDIVRVVSEPLHSKGRFRYIVCGTRGRYAIVAPESKINPDTDAMKRLPPGSIVEIGPVTEKGDGFDVSRGFVRLKESP